MKNSAKSRAASKRHKSSVSKKIALLSKEDSTVYLNCSHKTGHNKNDTKNIRNIKNV
jgi:hypothetical protein